MINRKIIFENIELAIFQIDNYHKKYYPNHTDIIHIRVLKALRNELNKENDVIEENILRGFKDVCTSIAIHYEENDFFEPIFIIYDELNRAIPNFSGLEPLRNNFSKVFPPSR